MDKVIQTIKNIAKYPFVVISAVFGILLLYLKYLKNKNLSLEVSTEENSEKKQDAVLSQQQEDLKAQNAAAIAKLEQEKGAKLTPEELNEYLNKL